MCKISFPAAAAAAKSLQSRMILCKPIDGSPPGSPVPGVLQARALGGLPFLLQCVTVTVKSLSLHNKTLPVP